VDDFFLLKGESIEEMLVGSFWHSGNQPILRCQNPVIFNSLKNHLPPLGIEPSTDEKKRGNFIN
jgi:hypothetical protein